MVLFIVLTPLARRLHTIPDAVNNRHLQPRVELTSYRDTLGRSSYHSISAGFHLWAGT